jgi:hypothetical protein
VICRLPGEEIVSQEKRLNTRINGKKIRKFEGAKRIREDGERMVRLREERGRGSAAVSYQEQYEET